MEDVRYARVGKVRLAYQELGVRGHPTVLLVMGQGTQMLVWPDDVCTALVARGLHVVRFDNRDSGESTHLPGRRLLAYTLTDLAEDTVGLLDALGVPAAHLVGMSMGAMIAQVVATTRPQRVLSLTCIASSTGSRRVGGPRPRLLQRLPLRRRTRDRVEAGDLFARVVLAIGSPAYPVDPDRLRDLGARCYDRGHHPLGSLRHLLAVVRTADRTAALAGVLVPTLVLHGDADPLIAVSGGRAVAAAVPGARLVTVPGMGHDLPMALWPLLVEEIHRVVIRGEQRRATAYR